jgi:hypothetical protein
MSHSHPLGIKPIGNSFIKPTFKKERGLGLFNIFNDHLLIEIIIKLGPFNASKLSCCSKAFMAFCSFQDIWRQFTIQYFKGNWKFKRNWKSTFVGALLDIDYSESNIDCDGIYSDILYISNKLTTIPIHDLCGVKDNIDRRSDLSLNDFINEYAIPNKPVIITDIVDQWPAFTKWDFKYLCELSPEKKYRAEAIDITFRDYYEYMTRCNEESPIYLFDKFCALQEPLKNDFDVPKYFDSGEFC